MKFNTKKISLLTLLFCIYTLLFPVLSCILSYLNLKYGISCGDSCTIHSYSVYYLIQSLFIGMGILNITLFILCRKKLNDKCASQGAVICNCIFSVYGFTMAASQLMFIIIMIIPAIITIPIQFGLLWYVFLREILQKESGILLVSSILGIISNILFFLTILHF